MEKAPDIINIAHASALGIRRGTERLVRMRALQSNMQALYYELRDFARDERFIGSAINPDLNPHLLPAALNALNDLANALKAECDGEDEKIKKYYRDLMTAVHDTVGE